MQPQITRFNLHLHPDARHVSEAARILGVRDIDLFKLAHHWWFKRDPDETTLDKVFSDYLLNETIPHWARHYCQNVLNLESVDQLHPQDFGVDQPHKDWFSVNEQRFTAMITLLAFLVYLLFL